MLLVRLAQTARPVRLLRLLWWMGSTARARTAIPSARRSWLAAKAATIGGSSLVGRCCLKTALDVRRLVRRLARKHRPASSRIIERELDHERREGQVVRAVRPVEDASDRREDFSPFVFIDFLRSQQASQKLRCPSISTQTRRRTRSLGSPGWSIAMPAPLRPCAGLRPLFPACTALLPPPRSRGPWLSRRGVSAPSRFSTSSPTPRHDVTDDGEESGGRGACRRRFAGQSIPFGS